MPEFTGRIVDVPRLIFEKNSGADVPGGGQPIIRSHAVRWIVRWVMIIGYGFMGVAFAVYAVYWVVAFCRLLSWRWSWGKKYEQVLNRITSENPKASSRTMRQLQRQNLELAQIPDPPSMPDKLNPVAAALTSIGIGALLLFTAYLAQVTLRG